MDLWGGNSRKPIKTRVKTAVYLRAMGKCESCGVRLSSSKGHFHHTRSPNISPTAKTVQFLRPACHMEYGHKIKVIKDDFGSEERAVKRRRVGVSKKPKTKRKAIRDD